MTCKIYENPLYLPSGSANNSIDIINRLLLILWQPLYLLQLQYGICLERNFINGKKERRSKSMFNGAIDCLSWLTSNSGYGEESEGCEGNET